MKERNRRYLNTLLKCAEDTRRSTAEKGVFAMDEMTYTEIMKQDYPKDFADDDEFISALLDMCEI